MLIDLPGHGEGEAPDVEYTQEFFARAVGAVLHAEEVSRAVLVGHSMGGSISTMCLRLFPDRIGAIVYVDSFFLPPHAYLTHDERPRVVEEMEDDEQFAASLEMFWSPALAPGLRVEVRKVMTETAKHVRVSAVATRCLPHPFRGNEVYEIPALLMVTPQFSNLDQHWFHHIPNLKVHPWARNGHFLFMEDPVRFQREVEGFLEANSL